MKFTSAKFFLASTSLLSLVWVFSMMRITNANGAVGSDRAVLIQTDPTSTPDRLAEPTLPAESSQADLGAQDFWLHCLPCHGDRGQGLTDEFRLLYPVEEQNCWESGCHGNRPYENGWRLPEYVPPIIGAQLLNQFRDAAGLFSFIQSAMPFQDPGSLTDETYYRLVAFLARENRLLEPGSAIDGSNASALVFQGQAQSTSAATPVLQLPEGTIIVPTNVVENVDKGSQQNNLILNILFGILMAAILVLGFRAASGFRVRNRK